MTKTYVDACTELGQTINRLNRDGVEIEPMGVESRWVKVVFYPEEKATYHDVIARTGDTELLPRIAHDWAKFNVLTIPSWWVKRDV